MGFGCVEIEDNREKEKKVPETVLAGSANDLVEIGLCFDDRGFAHQRLPMSWIQWVRCQIEASQCFPSGAARQRKKPPPV